MSNIASAESQWTDQRTSKLIEMASEKKNNWKEIGRAIGINPKACRDKYVYCLDPNINHEPLSISEKQLIVQYQMDHGNKWAYIAALLNNRRNDRQVRNFWYSEQRKRGHQSNEGPERPRQHQASFNPMSIQNLLNPKT